MERLRARAPGLRDLRRDCLGMRAPRHEDQNPATLTGAFSVVHRVADDARNVRHPFGKALSELLPAKDRTLHPFGADLDMRAQGVRLAAGVRHRQQGHYPTARSCRIQNPRERVPVGSRVRRRQHQHGRPQH